MPLFWRNLNLFTTQNQASAPKKIDPATRFNTIPACGGKTDGRTDIILRLSCLNGWPRWRRARSEVVPVRRASQSTPGCCRGTCAQVPAQMRAADWTIRQRHQWRHLQPQQQPCSFYWLHRCCPKTPFNRNIRQYARLDDFNQQSKQKVWQRKLWQDHINVNGLRWCLQYFDSPTSQEYGRPIPTPKIGC